MSFFGFLLFELFAGAGYQVMLYDTVASQISGALENIKDQLEDMEKKELLKGPPKTAQEAFQLVSGSDDLDKALDEAFYVQVCIIQGGTVLHKSIYLRMGTLVWTPTKYC